MTEVRFNQIKSHRVIVLEIFREDMKGIKITAITLFSTAFMRLAQAQVDTDSLAQARNEVIKIESDEEQGQEEQTFASACPKTEVSPKDTAGLNIKSECPDLRGFSSDQTINDMKNTPGDVEIKFSTDSTLYEYQRRGAEVREKYYSPEEIARLKEDQAEGKKTIDYESADGSYKYKKDKDLEEESFQSKGHNWKLKRDKDK